MRHLRWLIIAATTLCVMALGAFALANRPVPPAPADDDIIIKGGSLEIQCGPNHKTDNAGCLALDDGVTGKFKHKQNKHITQIVVRNSQNVVVFDSNNLNANTSLGAKPEIAITYK
ncbi:MAG: hypothetical protein ACRD9S_20165 [Pyrinomonadaceae bacterium]